MMNPSYDLEIVVIAGLAFFPQFCNAQLLNRLQPATHWLNAQAGCNLQTNSAKELRS
jgi:hypothetical protein